MVSKLFTRSEMLVSLMGRVNNTWVFCILHRRKLGPVCGSVYIYCTFVAILVSHVESVCVCCLFGISDVTVSDFPLQVGRRIHSNNNIAENKEKGP